MTCLKLISRLPSSGLLATLRGPCRELVNARMRIPPSYRCMSSLPQNVDVSLDDSTGIAVLRMQKKPVNSLSLQMLTDLNIVLEKLENDDHCNALIVSSVMPKVFSAGLDLTELYQPKKEVLTEVWRSLQDFWLKLYGSRLVTVAAINGHCIAGGCLIALCCDYRIMASGPYKIGLNETQLGIEAPHNLMESMVNVIGQRRAERALQLGELYLPEEALKIGLVDEVVAESSVLQSAHNQLKEWLQIPGHARQLTKQTLRKETIDRMISRRNDALDYIQNLVTAERTQQIIGNYLKSLKKK